MNRLPIKRGEEREREEREEKEREREERERERERGRGREVWKRMEVEIEEVDEKWTGVGEEEFMKKKREFIEMTMEENGEEVKGDGKEGKGVYQKVVLMYLKSKEREGGKGVGDELLKEC
jgi:hypothetical protein